MGEDAAAKRHVVVLGGGPGGYAAAFHAADHGMQVTLVNAEHKPGGVCLHRGCIPSKALLHVAKLIQETREAGHWGVTFGEPKIDLDRVRGWKTSVVDQLTGASASCARRGASSRSTAAGRCSIRTRSSSTRCRGSPRLLPTR